jgi:hypothetical protein
MLYAIRGGFVEGYSDGQDPILHLEASVEAVVRTGLAFAFTDGHAELAVTDYFDDLTKLSEKVDWDVMRSEYWNDTADQPDRKRKRQAEFLVHHFAPWTLVHRIGVKTVAVKQEVEAILAASAHRPEVEVRGDWYYR